MKALLLTMTVILTVGSANAAKFECIYTKGWDRPANANAIKLAKALKVKTCNSEKFISYVKDNKHEMTPLKRNTNGKAQDLKFN